jgi:hypothetical protein
MFHEPSWFLRSGTYLVVFFIIVLVVLGKFLTYNDVLQGSIILSRENPAVNLKFKKEGIASFLNSEVGDTVRANSIVAVLENEATLDDVQFLKEKLLKLKGKETFQERPEFPVSLTLGTLIQPFYSKFYNLYNESVFFGFSSIQEVKINQINEELASLDKTMTIQAEHVNSSMRNSTLQASQRNRHQQLLNKGVISSQEWEQEEKNYLSAVREQQLSENQFLMLQRERLKLVALIEELENEKRNEQSRQHDQLNGARLELLAAISAWEENFLIRSPNHGRISYIRNIKGREPVTSNDIVLTVVPLGHQEIIGIAVFPSHNFSKVKRGQEALVKVDLYPYKEWGNLRVQVQSMKALPVSDGALDYEVEFIVKNLQTTYNHELEIDRELTGEVEILLDRTSILKRIFHQF